MQVVTILGLNPRFFQSFRNRHHPLFNTFILCKFDNSVFIIASSLNIQSSNSKAFQFAAANRISAHRQVPTYQQANRYRYLPEITGNTPVPVWLGRPGVKLDRYQLQASLLEAVQRSSQQQQRPFDRHAQAQPVQCHGFRDADPVHFLAGSDKSAF